MESEKYHLFKRRWAFLAAMLFLEFSAGWAFSCFGQISNFYVTFFRIRYSLVNWLTMAEALGPVISTLPLAWLAHKGILGFRNLSISGAVCSVLGFMFIAISTSCRSCFTVTFLGQFMNGLAMQLLLTTSPIFAVMWFPENEVGTAIAVNVVGLYLGNVLGLVIPSTSLHLKFYNSTVSEDALMRDNHILMILYVLFTALSLTVCILLIIFATDRPPTPPTEAQRHKTISCEAKEVPQSFWKQTKLIFKNRTVVLNVIFIAIIWEVSVVEFTTMSRIIQNFVPNHDVMGAYIMTVFSVGSAVGVLACGKAVDVFKRYKILAFCVAGFAFTSSVAIVISVQCKSYIWICVSNFVFGASTQSAFVVGLEISTQQTFPLDENFVSIVVVGCVLPATAFFGEIGEVIYKACGAVALLVFQSVAILFALILCCFYKIENKRLAADKVLPSSEGVALVTTPLLNVNENSPD